jgi:hypothetical protein
MLHLKQKMQTMRAEEASGTSNTDVTNKRQALQTAQREQREWETEPRKKGKGRKESKLGNGEEEGQRTGR